MKIGFGAGARTLGSARKGIATAEKAGFASAWLNNIFGFDAITACAVLGGATTLEVGTYVVPVQPRHPHALAQQALTAHDACDGRFTLGIGLSHQVVIENMLGLPFGRHASYLREYLSVLMPLLDTGKVSFKGEFFNVEAMLERPREDRPSVIVAALGPKMLKVAGELADGTGTWMTGPRVLATHTVPTITKAAADAGRPSPRVLAALPVCVTADVDTARGVAVKEFAHYGSLPSYRAMLDQEGAAEPADLAILGDEKTVEAALRTVAEAGVTELIAGVIGTPDEQQRTRELLTSLEL